ncbi:MAG TPA: hypothetical protein VK672_06230 [Solirubrobacteraceae bacterium]|nr:hypothetical protein [Solirubrobacteraceae bacterium]
MRVLTRRRAAVAGLIGYLLLAMILLGRTWFGGGLGQRLVGGGGDPLGFVWFLAWLPHALSHGHSPFFTDSLMAPQGANLLNSTAISLPSFLLWPVTATLGPTLSYDVLMTLGIVLSAWAAYFALRRIARHDSSAWIGGAIYGFGGYMTGQATAHVNLAVAVFPPVAAMLIDDIRRTRTPARTGALLGLCAAAQVFVNEELLAMTAIMALLALLLACCMVRPTHAMLVCYARALAAAAVVFAALAGPALLYQLFGPQHVRGAVVSSGRYVNDLAGFFVPNSLQWLSTPGSRHLTGGFSGYDGEWGSYLGIPLIALLVWAGWRLRRRALPLLLLLLGAALLSLGPHLRVLGHDTGVFLPWVLPNHLPLLEDVVPDRFNLFVWFAVAALLVLLMDDLRARPPFGRPLWGMAACVFALVPILPALTQSEVVKVPAVVGSASAFHRALPRAKTVLIVPSGDGQLAMYAQAKAGFAYSIPVGGVFVPSPDGPSYGMRQGPLLYALAVLEGRSSTQAGRTPTDSLCLGRLSRRARVGGVCRSLYLQALHVLHVDAVVVCALGSRSAARYTGFFTSLLGSPRKVEEDLVFLV